MRIIFIIFFFKSQMDVIVWLYGEKVNRIVVALVAKHSISQFNLSTKPSQSLGQSSLTSLILKRTNNNILWQCLTCCVVKTVKDWRRGEKTEVCILDNIIPYDILLMKSRGRERGTQRKGVWAGKDQRCRYL